MSLDGSRSPPPTAINPLVDACDIFIGVLYRKWGSDSGTHTSGFMEEFERAVERREAGEKLAVGMFFKHVPQAERDDAGPQLQRVLNFRARIQAEHILLYREFSDTADFERQLVDLLLHHVGAMVTASAAAPASPSDMPTPASVGDSALQEPSDTTSSGTPLNEAQVQLLEVFAACSALVGGESIHVRLDRDRLLLFASAVSKGPPLPTHETNRLFRRRRDLALTIAEAGHWLRTMARDWSRRRENRTIPGWAIFGKEPLDQSVRDLLTDADHEVVNGGLTLLTSLARRTDRLWAPAPFNIDDSDHRRVLERWQSLLANPHTAASATAYLGTVASKADLPLLDALEAAIFDDASRDTIRAVHCAISGDFTVLAASMAATRYGLERWKSDRLTAALPDLDTALLLMLLGAKDASGAQALKQAVVGQLAARGELTGDVVAAALASGDDTVAKVIIDAVRQRGDATEIFRAAVDAVEVMNKADVRSTPVDLPPHLLAATCTAEKLEAGAALDADQWEARLYQQGSASAPDARAMLNTEKDAWAGALSAPLRTALEDKALIAFVYARHVSAAIRYLSLLSATAPQDLDLIRARVHSTEWSIQAEAAKALARIGTAADVEVLLDAVTTASAINRDILLHAACTLGGSAAVEAAVGVVDHTTATVVVPFLAKLSDKALRSLLTHPVDAIRIAAADELSRQLDRPHLAALLDEYITGREYFYNVVVALDAELYGPGATRC